jgi:PAS domain S-box-containing protein
MGKELHVLILEDVAADAELMERELCRERMEFVSKRVETREAFLKELVDFVPDLILADYTLPSFDGLSALVLTQKQCPNVPFIFVSGTIGEDYAIETLKKGAMDYVLKSRLSRLAPAVKRALAEAEEQALLIRMEEALRFAAQEWRETFDAIIDCIWLVNLEGRIIRCNKATSNLLKKPFNEIFGQPWHQLIPGRSSSIEGSPLLCIGETKKREATVLSMNGRWFNVSADPLLDESDHYIGAVFVMSDITEQKRIEDTLQESEERYRSVVQAASDAIISTDINGNIIFWNDAAERIYGYSAEEVMGKLFTFVMPEGLRDYMKNMFRQVASTGQLTLPKGMIVEGKGIRKDGSEFPVENSFSSWKTKEGTYFTAIIRDITERKHINGLKDNFIGTVSHELRTPLSITKEGLSLVLEEIAGPVNEEQAKLLTVAKSNIDRLARLINDLLDISKLEAGRMDLKRALVDFPVMIQSICDRWKTETDKNCQSLECCVPDVPINIYIDPDKIIQVMDNLIANAVKFTPKEGKISVELKDRNDQIEISISDTGVGIAKENLPKVFNKFQQFRRTEGAGYKGTGLGLAIVKELVEMHKGEIKVKSEFNRGSKFTFSLPKMEAREVFKESINNRMKEADDKNVPLSFVVIYIVGLTELQEKLGADKAHDLRKDIEKQVRGSLRRIEDAVFNYEDTIIVLLPNCNKGGASSVRERLQAALDDYLVREKITDKVTVQFGSITYPDGIIDKKALFKKSKNGTSSGMVDEIMELF